MADAQPAAKVAYPYLTAPQWYGVRERLRKAVPKIVDVDWIMAALGGSEKGAQNLLPQLRAVGIIGADGRPAEELVHDLRDDSTYADACRRVREHLYPSALLDAWTDPDEDPEKVAAWFMRNAGTGAATAKMQARLYLLLLKGELPSPEVAAKKASVKKAAPAAPAKQAAAKKATPVDEDTDKGKQENEQQGQQVNLQQPTGNGFGPNLHIDLQIHIAADASDTQIDTVFKSMAKHLYGRG